MRRFWFISILALVSGCASPPDEPDDPEPVTELVAPEAPHFDRSKKNEPSDLCLTGVQENVIGQQVSIPVPCLLFYIETGYPAPDAIAVDDPASKVIDPAQELEVEINPEAR